MCILVVISNPAGMGMDPVNADFDFEEINTFSASENIVSLLKSIQTPQYSNLLLGLNPGVSVIFSLLPLFRLKTSDVVKSS